MRAAIGPHTEWGGFKYSVGMKFKMIAPFLAALLVSGLALAQSKPEDSKKDPLPLLKIAANIAGNIQDRNMDGFLVIYIDSQTWAAGLKDGDLGPFLKLKESKPGRSAVLFFPGEKDTGIAVFFDGDTAFGASAVKAKNGKLDPNDISTAYKPVAKEMLKDSGKNWEFNKGDVATDDGQAVTAYQMNSPGKKLTN